MTTHTPVHQQRGSEIHAQFELLVATVKDYAIFLLDPTGHVASWNAGAQHIKGYVANEVIGKHISSFYTPEDVAQGRPKALLDTAVAQGRVEDEGWRVRKDGSRFWADVVITALRDSDGRLQGFGKVTRDLTARKQAEERLRQSEEDLATTLYSIGDGVLAADEHGRVTRINPVAERLTGWSEKDAIGRPIDEVFNIVNEQTRAKVDNPIRRVLAEGVVIGLANHTALIARDGTERPIADSGAPIHDARGATRGAVLIFRDVTDERRAEYALRQSEESLSATLYSIGDGVLAADENARITRINPVAERLTGWSEKDAIGRPIDDVFNIINEDTRMKAVNPVRRVLAEGVVVGLANHTAIISREGIERPIADSGAPIRDAHGATRGAVLVFRDVTEERRAGDALRQSEEKLRLMIASISDYAIFMLDPQGRVASWNPGAEKITGYSEREIIGVNFSHFFTSEDAANGRPAQELATATAHGRFENEGWRTCKDGSRFWAGVVIAPMYDSAGSLVGFVKTTRDLTQPRRMEEERIRLAQAQEAVRLRDEFLSIASHELKTPLTALQLNLQSARDRAAPVDEKLAQTIDRATRIGQRLAQLIEALLDVSRISSGQLKLNREICDLADPVRDIVERLREAASRAGCELSMAVPAAVCGQWDRLRIEQVLMNLISNAIKYASGQPIHVSAVRDAETAVLQVRDNGPGIAQDQLARIFERFERAAPARHYGGMGLGLYVARQIAEAHGGTITVANVPDGGACFTVRLPLAPAT